MPHNASAHKVPFGEPDARLGNARSGELVGVRAPLRETEELVVRPYWLVDDIVAAVAAVVQAGVQGGNDHGFWQLEPCSPVQQRPNNSFKPTPLRRPPFAPGARSRRR
jgi:hypothetical protein